jgi:hypothetical protein
MLQAHDNDSQSLQTFQRSKGREKPFLPLLQTSNILPLRALRETRDTEPRRCAVVLGPTVGANHVANESFAAGGFLQLRLCAEATDDRHARKCGCPCRREGSDGEGRGGVGRATGWGEEEGHRARWSVGGVGGCELAQWSREGDATAMQRLLREVDQVFY